MPNSQRKQPPIFQQVANILRARITDAAAPAPMRLPTERELSQAHGVSRFTIRQALHILADEELIYRSRKSGTISNPDGIERWKRLTHPQSIAVFMSSINLAEVPATYLGQIYQGVLVASRSAGYALTNRHMSGSFPLPGQEYRPENPEQMVGVIMGALRDDTFISMHVQAGYPVVCVDHWPKDPLADAVVTDCFNEAQMAVDFLVSQGHRELFFVGNIAGGDRHNEPETDSLMMEAGYRRAATEAGLERSAERVHHIHRMPDYVADLYRWFSSLQPRPTAGIIFAEEMMDAFLKTLAQHELRCPDDVSLITKLQRIDPAQWASVRTDALLMGRSAVDLLMDRAAGRRLAGVRLAISSELRRGWTVRRLI